MDWRIFESQLDSVNPAIFCAGILGWRDWVRVFLLTILLVYAVPMLKVCWQQHAVTGLTCHLVPAMATPVAASFAAWHPQPGSRQAPYLRLDARPAHWTARSAGSAASPLGESLGALSGVPSSRALLFAVSGGPQHDAASPSVSKSGTAPKGSRTVMSRPAAAPPARQPKADDDAKEETRKEKSKKPRRSRAWFAMKAASEKAAPKEGARSRSRTPVVKSVPKEIVPLRKPTTSSGRPIARPAAAAALAVVPGDGAPPPKRTRTRASTPAQDEGRRERAEDRAAMAA